MSDLTRMELDRLEEEVAELTQSWLKLEAERDALKASNSNLSHLCGLYMTERDRYRAVIEDGISTAERWSDDTGPLSQHCADLKALARLLRKGLSDERRSS